ncbi:MAG: DNA adenine methylase [Anaerolineales bacterium]|nr:DNA adenine methylase [Anaerolineales bacterium]
MNDQHFYFPYPGGKILELNRISSLMPNGIQRVIEPFAGGGAFVFSQNKQAWLNDNHPEIANLYRNLGRVFADETNIMIDEIEHWKSKDAKIALGLINSKPLDDIDRASKFYIKRHLAYRALFTPTAPIDLRRSVRKVNWTDNLDNLWKRAQTTELDAFELLEGLETKDEDFIFLDPPYTVGWRGYSKGYDFGPNHQKRLASWFRETKSKAMIIMIAI